MIIWWSFECSYWTCDYPWKLSVLEMILINTGRETRRWYISRAYHCNVRVLLNELPDISHLCIEVKGPHLAYRRHLWRTMMTQQGELNWEGHEKSKICQWMFRGLVTYEIESHLTNMTHCHCHERQSTQRRTVRERYRAPTDVITFNNTCLFWIFTSGIVERIPRKSAKRVKVVVSAYSTPRTPTVVDDVWADWARW